MTLVELVDLLNSGGVLAILVLIVVGGWRRWYVWRFNYEEVRQDRDWWRNMALRGTGISEQVVGLKRNDAA
jgi:hypothetical protein